MSNMDFNGVLDDVDKNSPYWKLSDGQTIKGKFSGEFTKKESEINGKKVVKYEINFTDLFGETKVYSGSGMFFKECNSRLDMRGIEFEDAIFAIKREGTGLATKWLVDIVSEDKAEELPKVESSDSTEEAPF